MGRRAHWLVAALLVLVAMGAAAASAAYFSYEVRWRVRVVGNKLLGDLPEIPTTDLLRWLAPGSPVYLEQLAFMPNPHAVVANVHTDDAAAERGRAQFLASCAQCHGDDARGKMGPDLVDAVARSTDWSFFAATRWGREGNGMPAQALDEASIWDVHAFLRKRSLASAGVRGARVDDVRRFATAAAIPAANIPTNDWLTYAGNHAGHRHAGVPQLTSSSLADLQLAWVAQLRPSSTAAQASPIVSGGLLFATESREGVVAYDAATGQRVWHFRRSLPEGLKLCCGHPNRGAAILNDTLFITTLDAHLVALDAATGAKRWETRVAEASEGYSITGAPLAFGDRVVVGVAGSLFGVRGQIAAYSARDGSLLWRFWTVPAPGEPGHETWTDASWRTGGATTWTVGSYDPALDLVFWGVGNPAPVFDGDLRKGDNLYSNSVVALEASTGRLRWHYQFTPNDEHDWDAAQQPVLTDISWRGQRRAAVLWANRNGFFYALDRRSGEFLFARPFVKQTWADGFDDRGRPEIRADAKPSVKGTLVWPVVGGATSWWPPSLDESRRLMFVPAIEAAGIYFKGGHPENIPLVAGVSKSAGNQPSWAGIAAIDIDSGQVRWKTTLSYGDNVFRAVGGILSTRSGVLFAGYQDVFYAFDASDGRTLWSRRLGARVSGPPVAYRVEGRDHVAVAAGNSLFVFAAGDTPEQTDRNDPAVPGRVAQKPDGSGR